MNSLLCPFFLSLFFLPFYLFFLLLFVIFPVGLVR